MICPKNGSPCELNYCRQVDTLMDDPAENYGAELIDSFGPTIGGMVLAETPCSLLREERLEVIADTSEGEASEFAREALGMLRAMMKLSGKRDVLELYDEGQEPQMVEEVMIGFHEILEKYSNEGRRDAIYDGVAYVAESIRDSVTRLHSGDKSGMPLDARHAAVKLSFYSAWGDLFDGEYRRRPTLDDRGMPNQDRHMCDRPAGEISKLPKEVRKAFLNDIEKLVNVAILTPQHFQAFSEISSSKHRKNGAPSKLSD